MSKQSKKITQSKSGTMGELLSRRNILTALRALGEKTTAGNVHKRVPKMLAAIQALAKPEPTALSVVIPMPGHAWIQLAIAAERMNADLGEYIFAQLDWDTILDDGVNEFTEVPRKRAKSD